MFGVSWTEILVVVVVALIVVGPNDIPKVFYTAGRWLREIRIRFMHFQEQIEKTFHETEIAEVKKQLEEMRLKMSAQDQINKIIHSKEDIEKLADAYQETLADIKKETAKDA